MPQYAGVHILQPRCQSTAVETAHCYLKNKNKQQLLPNTRNIIAKFTEFDKMDVNGHDKG